MTKEEIQAQLAEIDGQIAFVNAARAAATSLSEVARLDNQLVALQAEHTRLELELANLQAAETNVTPLVVIQEDKPTGGLREMTVLSGGNTTNEP